MAKVIRFPLVTLAIPTFNRPDLLKRALDCVVKQDYPNLEVLIADNCSPGTAVEGVVDAFRNKIERLTFHKNAENIGSLRNFFTLLDRANGEYFMWLADDDEISPNYVSALAQLLVDNPDAVSGAGHWVLMLDEHTRKPMRTTSLPQRSPFLRASRFIWRADDAFFYGLHRTEVLRRAAFSGYWWPNKGEVLNWAYVFLLDMVLRGRVLLPDDVSVEFINHDYTVKSYVTQRSRLRLILTFLMRRVNVHYLYLVKVRRVLGGVVAIPLAMVSILSLIREFARYFGGGTYRRLWRLLSGT